VCVCVCMCVCMCVCVCVEKELPLPSLTEPCSNCDDKYIETFLWGFFQSIFFFRIHWCILAFCVDQGGCEWINTRTHHLVIINKFQTFCEVSIYANTYLPFHLELFQSRVSCSHCSWAQMCKALLQMHKALFLKCKALLQMYRAFSHKM